MGDKMMGAGNQQERLDAEWIVGFTDGEGCFHVGFNYKPKMSAKWQVLPEFRIVQHKNDEQVLEKIKCSFGFGKITVNNGDRKELRVRGSDLEKIVEFFKQHPLQTKKQSSFEKFAEIVDIMRQKRHLSSEGLAEIARLALQMNRRKNRSASRILRDCTPDATCEDTVRPP